VIAIVESDAFTSRRAYVAPKPARDEEADSPKTVKEVDGTK